MLLSRYDSYMVPFCNYILAGPTAIRVHGQFIGPIIDNPHPATSANHGQQPSPAVPALSQCQSEFRPTTPSMVKRYNSRSKQEIKLVNIRAGKRDYSNAVQNTVATGVPVYTLKELYFHDTIRVSRYLHRLLPSGDIELVVTVELTRNQNYHRKGSLMGFWASRSGVISIMLSNISTGKSVISDGTAIVQD
ncbi:hypothetical protein F4604DRAFT_1674239 [Suillus subluteus]|nr:hypothetical protein F4604DRAFT_1674239 [Suillus subluteus]